MKISVGYSFLFHLSQHMATFSSPSPRHTSTLNIPSPQFSTLALPSPSSLPFLPSHQTHFTPRPLLPPDQSSSLPSLPIPPAYHPLYPHLQDIPLPTLPHTLLNHSSSATPQPFYSNLPSQTFPTSNVFPNHFSCLCPSSLPPSGSSLASTQKPRVRPQELCIRWT